MKKSKAILAILAFAAVAAAAPVAAQDKGLYLGGWVGYAQYKDMCDLVGATGTCRDHDAAWRAFAGYSFSRHGALELGFVDFGDAVAVTGGTLVEANARGVDLVGVISFPMVDRLSFLLKLGIYRLRSTTETVAGRTGDTDSGFTYGAGLGYDLGRLGVRFEWQRYDSVGGITGDDAIDVFSVGALFRF